MRIQDTGFAVFVGMKLGCSGLSVGRNGSSEQGSKRILHRFWGLMRVLIVCYGSKPHPCIPKP